MATQRNYFKELRSIEFDLAKDIVKELKRVGKTFSNNNRDEVEFLGYSTTQEIETIFHNGEIKFHNVDDLITWSSALDNGDIGLYDAASFLNELHQMGRVKIREVK